MSAQKLNCFAKIPDAVKRLLPGLTLTKVQPFVKLMNGNEHKQRIDKGQGEGIESHKN